MLELVEEQLELNEVENEIARNTADAVYCPDGNDLNQLNEKKNYFWKSIEQTVLVLPTTWKHLWF